VTEPPGPAPEPGSLRRPQTVGGVIYLCVLAAVAAGVALAVVGTWRLGIIVIGAALGVAAAARAVLGDGAAGMLRVRQSRWVDIALLVVTAVTMVVLALTIPDQPV